MTTATATRALPHGVDAVSWSTFVTRMHWQQGDHVTLIGPTKSGKSTVATMLAPRRRFSVVLGTKPRDETLNRFRDVYGYKVVREWPPPVLREHVILWPRIRDIGDLREQRDEFAACLGDVYANGGWSVYIDELHVTAKTLGLSELVELLLTQGRSMGVSMMQSVQRPAHVPLVAYSQATHVLCWGTRDRRDLKRLSEVSGTVDVELYQHVVERLPKHAFAHANAATGDIVISRAPNPKG